MPERDLYTGILKPLAATGVPYMVTGGLAAIIYGDPRLTNDVDIVARLAHDDAARLIAAFPSPDYYTPPIEVIREESARPAGGHFDILDVTTSLRADVYCLGDDPLEAWAIDRRGSVRIADTAIHVAPIEYVILRKLQYYRQSSSDRHLTDIRAMRRISDSSIDQRALDEWIERLELRAEWTMTDPG